MLGEREQEEVGERAAVRTFCDPEVTEGLPRTVVFILRLEE